MPLRRSREIILPGGVRLKTPVLIPSLSTRNVGQLEVTDDGSSVSLASVVLQWLPGLITESLLVSAFDLHHDLLHRADELLNGAVDTQFHEPAFLMVDSGQYEVQQRPGFDDGTKTTLEWSPALMTEVYKRLPADLSVGIVNFDEADLTYTEQVGSAQELFADLPGRTSVMLLKPERMRGFLNVGAIAAVAPALQAFNIIAVTEKELGNTLSARLETLLKLRRALDQESVEAPLHVFGGLDPLLTPLYIMCGAEIVDGVGWLRYAYREDVAYYQEARAILDLDLDARVPHRILRTVNDNLLYLRDLKRRLQVLIGDEDWDQFSETRGKTLGDVWRRVAGPAGEA